MNPVIVCDQLPAAPKGHCMIILSSGIEDERGAAIACAAVILHCLRGTGLRLMTTYAIAEPWKAKGFCCRHAPGKRNHNTSWTAHSSQPRCACYVHALRAMHMIQSCILNAVNAGLENKICSILQSQQVVFFFFVYRYDLDYLLLWTT